MMANISGKMGLEQKVAIGPILYQGNLNMLHNLVPWVCLQFVIVVFPDHTHLLFWCQVLLTRFTMYV